MPEEYPAGPPLSSPVYDGKSNPAPAPAGSERAAGEAYASAGGRGFSDDDEPEDDPDEDDAPDECRRCGDELDDCCPAEGDLCLRCELALAEEARDGAQALLKEALAAAELLRAEKQVLEAERDAAKARHSDIATEELRAAIVASVSSGRVAELEQALAAERALAKEHVAAASANLTLLSAEKRQAEELVAAWEPVVRAAIDCAESGTDLELAVDALPAEHRPGGKA